LSPVAVTSVDGNVVVAALLSPVAVMSVDGNVVVVVVVIGSGGNWRGECPRSPVLEILSLHDSGFC